MEVLISLSSPETESVIDMTLSELGTTYGLTYAVDVIMMSIHRLMAVTWIQGKNSDDIQLSTSHLLYKMYSDH